MPASRKPRKKYVKKGVLLPFIQKEDIENLKDILNEIGLVIEFSLLRGTVTHKDMSAIRDFFNWMGFVLQKRYEEFADGIQEAILLQQDAVLAVVSLCQRTLERNDQRYIATGDEIKAIREAYSVFNDYLQRGLDETPLTLVRDFEEMKDYLKRDYQRRNAANKPHRFFSGEYDVRYLN